MKAFNYLLLKILLYAYIFFLIGCVNQYIDDNSLEIYPHYYGDDLGLTYSNKKSSFKVWSPAASSMKLKLYDKGEGGALINIYHMTKSDDGTWEITINEDLEGKFYTYQPVNEGKEDSEVQDPYSFAVGVNGNRSAVIDLKKTNPENWEEDARPPLSGFNDIILYEMQIRDFSIDPQSGIKNKGKYLGLTESATKGSGGISTGLDHLSELGITHVHLLPVFDFASLDEIHESNNYNWGYDPKNFNVPEGTFSTDPTNPALRIFEFKSMVKALHDKGIRVVMDVVYNHTHDYKKSCFQGIMPDYFYRQNSDGSYSNASACGNELATERTMVRKMILESLKYWAQEYHIDGFRFDLMGIIDIETMNAARKVLDEIDPTIFMYGEGWSAGASSLDESNRAVKANMKAMPRIAAFSDELRDAVKGSYSNHAARGFVSGEKGLDESIKFGIVAATLHPQVKYKNVNYSDFPWAKEPDQCINYVSCHDDLTLWDKIKASNPDENEGNLIKMQLLSNTIVLTSQGIPFVHAGSEFLRSKGGDSNSYESADSVNMLQWSQKREYAKVVSYYKNLIALRKDHPAFRMDQKDKIQKNLNFYTDETENLIVYELNGAACNDKWKKILVAFNGTKENIEINLPEGNWDIVLSDGKFLKKGPVLNKKAVVSPISALILKIEE